ncbi:MAG: hypothetical protein HY696_04140 [Deltaproteobacteria bacterium]|nr:hypothetical protein [Deltaproteobacteria bacterium]
MSLCIGSVVQETIGQLAALAGPAACVAAGHWSKLKTNPPLILLRTVARWHGALWVGGLGGAAQWQPAAQAWKKQNDGLLPPQWSNQPFVTTLVPHGDHLWLIQVSAGPNALLRRSDNDLSWTGMPDAPTNARTLLTSAGHCFLGSAEGVAQWDDASDLWAPISPPLEATVTALAPADESSDDLFVGTAAGAIWLLDPWAQVAWNVNASVDGTAIRALQPYGDYQYVATADTLHRCWNFASSCEPIDPAAGFGFPEIPTALAVWKGQLFLGASDGVYRLDADEETWQPLQSGFPSHPVIVQTLTATSRLYAATEHSLWRWRCGK